MRGTPEPGGTEGGNWSGCLTFTEVKLPNLFEEKHYFFCTCWRKIKKRNVSFSEHQFVIGLKGLSNNSLSALYLFFSGRSL